MTIRSQLFGSAAVVVLAIGPSTSVIAQGVNVNVSIAELSRFVGTDGPGDGSNDRDEIFINVSGQTPRGGTNSRLPRSIHEEDYYEFQPNRIARAGSDWEWTNQEQADQGNPEIWHGQLLPGESAKFLVMIREQDNKDLKDIKMVVKASLEGLGPSGEPFKPLVDAIPEKDDDDLIGVIAVLVRNEADQVVSEFWAVPVEGLKNQLDKASPSISNYTGPGNQQWGASFNMSGTGGANYTAIVTATPTPQSGRKARKWLCKERDGTGDAGFVDVQVWYQGKMDSSRIEDNKSRLFHPNFDADKYFHWNDERTRPSNRNTTIVLGRFSRADETVYFSCFQEVDW